MKKKILAIFFIYLFINIFCYDYNVLAVTVDGGSAAGGGGGSAGCGGYNCYETGTAGLRISIVDKNGNLKYGPVDYWYKGSGFMFNNKYRYMFRLKANSNGVGYIKQQVMNKSKADLEKALIYCQYNNDEGYCDDFNFKTFNALNKLLSPSLDMSGTENPRYANKGSYFVERMTKMGQTAAAADNLNDSNWKIYNKIFSDLEVKNSKGKKATVKNYDLSGIYIQFEPLVTFANNYIYNSFGTQLSVFYGTISELAMIGYRNCGSDMKKIGYAFAPFAVHMGIDDAPYIGDGFRGAKVTIKKFALNSSFSGYTGDGSSTMYCSNFSGVGENTFFKKNKNDKYYAYAVSWISLDDILIPPPEQDCDDLLTDAIVKYEKSSKKSSDLKAYNAALDSIKKTTGDDLSFLKDAKYTVYGMSSSNSSSITCSPTCRKTFNNYSDTSLFISNVLEKDLFYNYSQKIKNSNGKLAFGASLYRKYKTDFKKIAKRINNALSGDDICEPIRCEDALDLIDSNNKQQVKKLDSLFNPDSDNPNYPLLKEENYSLLSVPPSCESLPPNCEPEVSSSCSTGEIKIGPDSSTSTSNHQNCVKKGVLYYGEGGANLHSSYNAKYSSQVNSLRNNYYYAHNLNTDVLTPISVYCGENVEFEMPVEESTRIKAGNMFRWGVDVSKPSDSQDKNVFAKMKITQDCYLAGENDAVLYGNVTFDSASIKTKMQVNYKDITGTYKTGEGQTNTGIFNTTKVGNASYSKISATSFKFVANYTFNYNKSLTWYASKGSENPSSVNSDKYESFDSNKKEKYVYIGYGLPTSLSTPDGTYTNKLIINITKVGSNGIYDSLFSNGKLEYNCPFKVHNELFGNECCNKETGEPYPGAPDYCTCNGTGDGPKGMDVVFRTIELTKANPTRTEKSKELAKAFPGRTGSNTARKIGSNWQEVVDNNTVYSILDDSVYTKSPQYSIKLNTTNISKIRDYNKSSRNARVGGENVDPYTYLGTTTGSDSNGFIGYKCDSSKGAYGYCVSNFLEKLRSSLGLKGTCMTRSPDINTRLSRGVCGQ